MRHLYEVSHDRNNNTERCEMEHVSMKKKVLDSDIYVGREQKLLRKNPVNCSVR